MKKTLRLDEIYQCFLFAVEGKCESGSENVKGRVLGSDSIREEDEVLEVRDGVETGDKGLDLGMGKSRSRDPSYTDMGFYFILFYFIFIQLEGIV